MNIIKIINRHELWKYRYFLKVLKTVKSCRTFEEKIEAIL